jgi:hypothetical protein
MFALLMSLSGASLKWWRLVYLRYITESAKPGNHHLCPSGGDHEPERPAGQLNA